MLYDSKHNIDLYRFHDLYDGSILLSYKGPLEENILAAMGSYVKVIAEDNNVVSMKIFKIFMELAQNVSFYSAEFNSLQGNKKSGVGSLMVVEDKDKYYFYCGNKVKNADVVPIIDKCEVINSLDREALREFKRKQRKMPRSSRGGGNIGLIQIALTSENPIGFQVSQIDDEISFFAVSVTINKR